MWADVSNSVQVFEGYKDFIERDFATQEVLFDILVDLLYFAVFTIKTVKHIRFQMRGLREHLRTSVLILKVPQNSPLMHD